MSLTAIQAPTFEIKLNGLTTAYPIVPAPANPNIGIVYLHDLNDNYFVAAAIAKELNEVIFKSGLLSEIDVLLMPGDSANMLGTLLFQNLMQNHPTLKFCIIRASPKGGSYKQVEYQSLTSVHKKTLHLRKDQFETIYQKKVLIFDDIISSGATLQAVTNLAGQAQAKVIAFACFATEGNLITSLIDKPIFKLNHLPTFDLQPTIMKS